MAKAKSRKTTGKTQRPEGGGGEAAPAAEKPPRGLARRVEAIDAEILRLAQERAELVAGAPAAAPGAAAPAEPAALADDGLDHLLARSKGPLARRTVRAIFRELQSGCRALVRQRRISFLGPQYSYSHMAALHRFGQGVEYVPVGTIPAVFEEVNRGHSDFGIVPIENSTDGRIADTLDMFTRLPVRICGEVEMRIHHTLLGKSPRSEVKEVYSRPQALSQCRNWLARHLPAARLVEVTSTSTAAQLARDKPGAAAVASHQAGVQYGLEVLAENIEDNPANTTRFAVIGEQSAPRTGNDRTAMLFQTQHRFGALVDALAVFKRNRLNLTWIESFPVPESDRAYLFFIELEGHESDLRVRRAIGSLEGKTLRLEVLGSFPVGTIVD